MARFTYEFRDHYPFDPYPHRLSEAGGDNVFRMSHAEAIELRDLLLREFPVEPAQAIYARGTHHYSYRSGQWARVLGLEPKNDRVCLSVRFDDGATDLWPVFAEPDVYEFRVGAPVVTEPAQAEPTPEPDPDEVQRALVYAADESLWWSDSVLTIIAAARAWLRSREQQPVPMSRLAAYDAGYAEGLADAQRRTPAVPTIAQVIEACGGGSRIEVFTYYDGWIARVCAGGVTKHVGLWADTPEAALSKLYADAIEKLRQQRDEAQGKLAKLEVEP